MGVTVDLIPRLPGEDPERAIARIYEGAVAIRWDSETEGSCTYLWSRNSVWQVEIDDGADSITLRARRGWNPDPDLPDLDDSELLEAFDGLRTILHWPDAYGTWCDLDDPDDRPMLIG